MEFTELNANEDQVGAYLEADTVIPAVSDLYSARIHMSLHGHCQQVPADNSTVFTLLQSFPVLD